eukprot:NODE_580_length_1588_cov_87.068226_g476_i0.p1 GENE.NODE_580_length_1588_cov_87.068226_g476_i0~~NODE_580_length_1588_cov_87.068226_g476_i0.p1  ORF type:complete len:489 (+),score=126.31 NODE_580_length_1588_cov_87.068226_g476_i0:25-1467(+)
MGNLGMDLEPSLTLRQKIYCILDTNVPTSSTTIVVTGQVFGVLFAGIVVVSVCVFCMSTLPSMSQHSNDLELAEWLCVGAFTVELLVRLLTCQDRAAFFRSPLNWVDLLSVVVPYTEMLLAAVWNEVHTRTTSILLLRTLRLLRVFRTFKLTKYNLALRSVMLTFRGSADTLLLLLLLFIVGMLVGGSALYYVENLGATFSMQRRQWERNGNATRFQNIPSTFYFTVTTMTTVGYGDELPETDAGKAIAAVCMLVGMLALGFPIIILTASFHQQHLREKYQAQQREKLRRMMNGELKVHPLRVIMRVREAVAYLRAAVAARHRAQALEGKDGRMKQRQPSDSSSTHRRDSCLSLDYRPCSMRTDHQRSQEVLITSTPRGRVLFYEQLPNGAARPAGVPLPGCTTPAPALQRPGASDLQVMDAVRSLCFETAINHTVDLASLLSTLELPVRLNAMPISPGSDPHTPSSELLELHRSANTFK